MKAAPAPLYRTGDAALNVLPYVPGRILSATPDELAVVSRPAWMVLPTAEAEILLSRRRGELRVVMPFGDSEQWRLLHLDR